jgi:hypothetical protein
MLRYFKWKPTLPLAPQLHRRMCNEPIQLLHLLRNAQCDGGQGVDQLQRSHDMMRG